MKNLQSLFYILVFFLIVINALIEILPVFLILIGIGVILLIVVKTINDKKIKKLELIKKEREKIKKEERIIQQERQQKIRNIQEICKTFTNLLNKDGLAKQEKLLKSVLSTTQKSEYDKPFLDINIKRNQLKYDIAKCALSCIDAINQDNLTDDMLANLDTLISEYDNYKTVNDGFVVSNNIKKKFGELISLIEEVRNNSFTMLATDNNLSNLNLCSGPYLYYYFNYDFYLNVQSSEKVIHIKSRNTSLYLYPLFIIEANNNQNFMIHHWDDLTFESRTIRAFTKGYNSHVKGAIELCHQYEHSCVDGSPDRRYKQNDIYRMYNVRVIKCKQIPSFNFIVADETYATRLVTSLNTYAVPKTSKNDASEKETFEEEQLLPFSFFSTLDYTMSEYGVEILKTKKVFYVLSDLGCFKNNSKLKNLFMEIINDQILETFLISEIRNPEIEVLAVRYSSKFNYSVDECVLILNGVQDTVKKHRLK